MIIKIVIFFVFAISFFSLVFLFLITKDPLYFFKSNPPSPSLATSQNLITHVKKISQEFFPRSSFHLHQLNQTADYIRDQWQKLGFQVKEQVFHLPATNGTPYKNLMIQITPEVKSGTDPRLIIGAHYDAHEESPGADDNASGIAGLLELSRLLAQTGPIIPIDLVAFTNEESPFFGTPGMGAYQHAQELRESGQKILGMISLEMIGYFTEKKNSQKFPLGIMKYFYPDQGNFIAFVSSYQGRNLVRKIKRQFAKNSDFPLESFLGPSHIQGLLASDHYAFLQWGFPAMMISDTAYYRNENYHTPNDKPETLNYKATAKLIDGIHQMLVHWT